MFSTVVLAPLITQMRLAFGVRAVRAQVGPAADAAERETVLPPHGGVAGVGAGLDLDDVAVACHAGRGARRFQDVLRSDAVKLAAGLNRSRDEYHRNGDPGD